MHFWTAFSSAVLTRWASKPGVSRQAWQFHPVGMSLVATECLDSGFHPQFQQGLFFGRGVEQSLGAGAGTRSAFVVISLICSTCIDSEVGCRHQSSNEKKIHDCIGAIDESLWQAWTRGAWIVHGYMKGSFCFNSML